MSDQERTFEFTIQCVESGNTPEEAWEENGHSAMTELADHGSYTVRDISPENEVTIPGVVAGVLKESERYADGVLDEEFKPPEDPRGKFLCVLGQWAQDEVHTPEDIIRAYGPDFLVRLEEAGLEIRKV